MRNMDAISDMARIAHAAVSMMQRTTVTGRLYDPNDDIGHIQANLDHLRRLIEESRA